MPLGWLMDRLAAPFVRWDEAGLLTPEVTIPIRGLHHSLDGFRVALVADLHGGPCVPRWWLNHIVARTTQLRPDVVILAGDFVSHARSDLNGLDEVLAQLAAPEGVFAVLGNHDHWIGAEHVVAVLERAGVRVLINDRCSIQRGDATLVLAGVDDFTHGAVRLDEALDGVPSTVPRLLVSHNPDLIEYLPDDLRVDLVLSGHTHNGQLHLPFVGPITVPSQFGGAYLQGLKRRGATQLYVSAGVGMASVPFRWGNPPELPVLVLEPLGHPPD